jgi:hypothetical protein
LRAWGSVFNQPIEVSASEGAPIEEELKQGLLSVAEQVVPLYAINKGYCVVSSDNRLYYHTLTTYSL